MQVSQRHPGKLFRQGMVDIRKHLALRGGADSETPEMSLSVVQYVNSVFHGRHPPGEMSQRNVHELRLLAECLDSLVSGRLTHLGDVLMQRLKAIEQATKDGHWAVAQYLEVSHGSDVGLASPSEMRAAVRAQLQDHRLRESTSKSHRAVP